MKNKLALLFVLFAFAAHSQPISYFNSIFLQQQNAAQDLAWLGIGGTNKGLGTVTNFTATGFPPLFSSAVSTPTTYPHLAFTAIPQGSNLVFASPDGVTGIPTFRRLTANDIPGSGGSGTVTSFSSDDLPPIFTTSVATPTTTPALSYTLTSQSANTVFAGPTSGGSSAPTFRALVAGDIPDISETYLPLAGGTMSGTINLASGGINFGSSPMFQDSANTVAIRNGTTAQSLNIYNTFTSSSNFRAGSFFWNSADFHMGMTSAGAGSSSGNLYIDVAGMHRMVFRANATDLWQILDPSNGGNFEALTDNTQDIGEPAIRRPRTGYFGTSVVAPEMDTTTLKSDNLIGLSGDLIKLNGPLELNDAAADGRIVAADGTTTLVDPVGNHFGVFNGSGVGLTNVVFNVTNASLNVDPTRITMINRSNTPANGIVAMKSISAGSGVSLTDQLTNVVISATGGGASATNLNDLYMTNLTSYANNSNYFIDFTFPSAILTSATNVIAFNYSTNWGLANTSRVCNISVPPTNFGRIVTFANAATNWHIQPMIFFIPLGYGARFAATQFGQGETNVTISPFLDTFITTTNTTASYNPTNALPSVGLIGSKLWLDASVKAWQDETLTVPCVEGLPVRGWTDLTGVMGVVTNNTTTAQNLFYHSTALGPYNVPCMSVYPGQSGALTWLQAPSITALSQPITIFIMYYGRSGGVVVDSVGGGRVAINPGQMGQTGSAFNSSGIAYTSAKTVGWTLVTYVANGASSAIRTNGVVAVTGNAGTTSPSQFIVFGDNVHSVQVGSYNVAEILVCATNMSNTQLTNAESYFYRKYPFFNPPTVQ